MSLWKKLLGQEELTEAEYDEKVEHESAKVRAFRKADEVSRAADDLMVKVRELRSEIEALSDE